MARGWGNLAPHYAPPPSSIFPEETRLRVIQGGLKSKYSPHIFQEEVVKAMRRFSVLVCHRRWGKTVLATKILDSAARRAHMRGKVKAQYAYIAPFLKQARRAAWPYLQTWAGQFEGVKISEYNLEITYPNEAKILVFGADNPDAMRGFYFDGAVMDEVADMKPDTWETVIRPTLSDHKGWAMFIGTPKGENLFFDLHLQALKEMAAGSPLWWTKIYPIWATVDQLPQLDRSEVELSRDTMRPEAFRQEWEADFSASCDNVLIPLDVISESMRRTAYEADFADYPLVLSVDVARHGLDSAVITARRGLIVYPQIVLKNIDNMTLAARVASEIDRRGADAVFIDGGRGEGVIDRLRQLGYQVLEVHFQGTAEDSTRYANKRIEMWDRIYDFLQAGGILPDSPELRRELSAPTYRHNAKDQMVLESKDDIKERLGFSPDQADSLAISFAAPVVRKDIRERQRREAERKKEAYNPLDHYEKAIKGRA